MLFFFFVLPYYVCDIHMLLFCTSSTVDTLQLWCTQNSSSLSSSRRITSRHRLPVNWPWLKPIWKEPKNVPSLVKSMFHVWCFDANIGFERCWLIVVVVEISLCFFSRVFHYCIYAAGSKSENFNNAFSCVCLFVCPSKFNCFSRTDQTIYWFRKIEELSKDREWTYSLEGERPLTGDWTACPNVWLHIFLIIIMMILINSVVFT